MRAGDYTSTGAALFFILKASGFTGVLSKRKRVASFFYWVCVESIVFNTMKS